MRFMFRRGYGRRAMSRFAKINRRGRKKRVTQGATRRLIVEHLEDRRLLASAVGLDSDPAV